MHTEKQLSCSFSDPADRANRFQNITHSEVL